MSEPKPLASLCSTLLARKGDARPAIRRAHVPTATVAHLPATLQREEPHDDLGWNDIGQDTPATVTVTPAVVKQQEKLVQSFSKPAKDEAGKAVQPRTTKAAFTLRLDAERHLRLRLASAVGNRSAQRIVTQALDAFLDKQPGLDALVAQARKDDAER